ncbi:MAG: isoaspartyl peptidase/L-asparaginase [Phycisphaeraceae bacterium]|nr:isoaspartyl peptidase/L-asparaginase [Phycisphaeraceae bacterium]MBX3405971.1 isoaspartyl peptidase/L-asparaginase [Phycisphaeraceae bacterium]
MNRACVAIVLACVLVPLMGCRASGDGADAAAARTCEWAIVLHGGAGVIDKSTPPERVREYTDSLARALAIGVEMLEAGRSALDAVEAVVMTLEDDEKFNAGRGAVFTAEGRNELDASIMDGATLKCGAVAGVTTIKNPIRLARRVMEMTRHIILSREGAEAFASSLGPDIARVDPAYFFTTRRWRVLEEVLKERNEPMPALPKGVSLSAVEPADTDPRHRDTPAGVTFGTVGCVALDRAGNLAAATSTGGMSGKRWARIGDSPIIGAGNYANNASCAVSGTGTGEEFIRHGVARDISDRMLYKRISLAQAANEVVHGVLKPDDGGIIAVSRTGEIAMVFNSDGMFRAAADSRGRLEVGIWERPEMQASGGR